MPSPKRALFSLNLDSNTHQRVDEHNDDGTSSIKVLETKGPTTTSTHSDLTFITKPFEKIVNQAVDEVIEGSGKKVKSAEGNVWVETSRSERETGAGSLNVVSKKKRRAIEEKYDTSEL